MARIFLSASSQEANLGVIAGYVEELECNKIAHAAGAHLERSGHVVGYNDPGDTYKQHVEKAKAFRADIIVCIHTNAASDPNASGMRAGCYDHTDPKRESTKLTQAIFDAIAPVTPSLNDKMTTYRFFEVVENVPPVAYIETSFHTNPIDCQWILDNGTGLIARKYAEGISAYLKTPLVLEASTPTPDWQATINAKDTQIAELAEKNKFLVAEVFASQQRVVELQNVVQTTEQERDNYRNDLAILAGIIKKY